MNKSERFYVLDSALGMTDKDFNFVRTGRNVLYVRNSRSSRNSNTANNRYNNNRH